jgi:hypothetical protein
MVLAEYWEWQPCRETGRQVGADTCVLLLQVHNGTHVRTARGLARGCPLVQTAVMHSGKEPCLCRSQPAEILHETAYQTSTNTRRIHCVNS